MSDRRQSKVAVVSRNYRDSPDFCARAIELLLRWKTKEATPISRLDNAERRSSEIGVKPKIPQEPD